MFISSPSLQCSRFQVAMNFGKSRHRWPFWGKTLHFHGGGFGNTHQHVVFYGEIPMKICFTIETHEIPMLLERTFENWCLAIKQLGQLRISQSEKERYGLLWHAVAMTYNNQSFQKWKFYKILVEFVTQAGITIRIRWALRSQDRNGRDSSIIGRENVSGFLWLYPENRRKHGMV